MDAWLKHHNLYQQLFNARSLPEGMELVASFVRLRGSDGDKPIDRHLLAAPAVVDLNEATGLLSVRIAESLRVETSWMPQSVLASMNAARAQVRALVEHESIDELSSSIDLLCNALGTSYAPDGQNQTTFAIAPSPAVMLRRRESSAVLELLNDMVESLRNGGNVPEPMKMLLDPKYSPTSVASSSIERPALALAADNRQRTLVQKALSDTHTVIQGPPGTGKTHTIANLLSALLAEGKRVMVTAENERALREVQGKMPSGMQSLLLPLFKDAGSTSVAKSVNDILSRTSAGSVAELEQQILDLEEMWDLVLRQTRSLEEELRRIAALEYQERTIEGVSMRLVGHLQSLGSKHEQLALVDELISPTGHLYAKNAAALIDAEDRITEEHTSLAILSVPESPLGASQIKSELDQIDSALRALPPARDRSFAPLGSDRVHLELLERRLLTAPPVAWADITEAAGVYSEASGRARSAATRIRHDISLSPGSLTNLEDVDHATAVLELLATPVIDNLSASDLIGLLAEIESETTAREVPTHRCSDPYAMRQACVEGLRSIRDDRTGLLGRYALDIATSNTSELERVIAAAASLASAGAPVCPPISIGPDAPALHELLEQAEGLLEHLRSGGKMSRLIGVPAPVQRAAGLIANVFVDGSEVDTAQEAAWVVEFIKYQQQVASVERRLDKEGVEVPTGISLQQWVVLVEKLSEAATPAVEALRMVGQARASLAPLPSTGEEVLSDGKRAADQALIERLAPIAELLAKKQVDVLISGRSVVGSKEAAIALEACKAARERIICASLLPDAWVSSSGLLDGEDDQLTNRLEIAALAAGVEGWVRTAELSSIQLLKIREQIAADSRRVELSTKRRALTEAVESALATDGLASAATQAARLASGTENWEEYAIALLQVERERSLKGLVTSRNLLLSHVREQHPHLAAAFETGVPEARVCLRSIEELESLARYKREVEAWRESSEYPGSIHSKLQQLHGEARSIEQELSEARCWLQVAKRLAERPELGSALSALDAAVQKVPKTKTVPSYPSKLRALQDRTREAAPAIPAWVLSMDRAAELLGYPSPEDRFDVIIIDEASQAWFPAMFLYAMADKVIVVGDDLQTSPAVNSGAASAIRSIAVEKLGDHRIAGQVGDDLSIYDIARSMTQPALLVDHFRCVPEIIELSMQLSYSPNGKHLNPAKVSSGTGLPPVNRVRVAGDRASGSINMAEVAALVDQVVSCHVDYRYAGKSFGVVVAGSDPAAQIREIQNSIMTKLGVQAMAAREIEVGTAAQFQGAERDVMFISMLDVPGDNGKLTARPQEFAGNNRRYVQQLNVAVSRAKEQLWIFHSFDAHHLHPGSPSMRPDARLVLLQSRAMSQPSLQAVLAACGSRFEQDVVRAIYDNAPHLRIRNQVSALGYSIDIVVEGQDGSRLAIECDGDKYHTGAEKIRADLFRERTLESIGWSFYRFFASEWYSDPAHHISEILSLLSTQGVAGNSNATANTTVSHASVASQTVHPVPGIEAVAGFTAPADLVGKATLTDCFSTTDEVSEAGEDSEAVSNPELPTADRGTEVASQEGSVSKKDTNRLLAQELRLVGKPANGEVWTKAKELLMSGRSIRDAARLA
jgi:very-short-patch-repair endonuclease